MLIIKVLYQTRYFANGKLQNIHAYILVTMLFSTAFWCKSRIANAHANILQDEMEEKNTSIPGLITDQKVHLPCIPSKKINNDQELIQSDPTSCPQNQKGNN